ncbi:MAG: hypothetical protein ACKKL6_03470 [Candidatus Komeilibacteria bacterium]
MSKITTIILTVCFLTTIFGAALAPQQAYALPTFDAATVIEFTWQKIKDVVKNFVTLTVKQLVIDASDMFLQKFAYETAVSLATGDRGQGTLFEGRVFQNILKDAAGAAAGDFIGGLSDEWSDLGIDLCNPDLDIKATITMSLLKNDQIIQPRCDLANIVRNWESFVAEQACLFGEGCTQAERDAAQAALVEGLQIQFRPGKSDFSAQLSLNDKLIAKKETQERDEIIQTLKSTYRPVLNTTKTQVKSGAEDVQSAAQAPANMGLQFQGLKLQVAANSEHPVLARAAATFTNTLTSTFLENLINGLYDINTYKNFNLNNFLFGTPYATSTPGTDNSDLNLNVNPYANPVNTQTIEKYYSEAFAVSPSSIEQYDPANDFVICPDENIRNLNNCVMDPKFYSAFSKNEPITVAEAIQLRLIDANTPLISKDSHLHSDLQYCHKDALCYSNLQKMRLARFIPLGWEIAASKSPVDSPVTLGEVIAQFNVSGSDYESLIDPDWILVAPAAQCRASGYGPVLETPSSTNRSEICVDAQTCLKTDGNGECLPGAWGYCTREKNVWQFGGEQCLSAYASCRSYTSDQGTDYYIKDTLDFCTADEVGCRWYSTTVSSYGDNETIWDENSQIRLNAQAGTCEGQNAGCSELIKIEPGVNLVYNGDFSQSTDGAQPDNWGTADEYSDGKIKQSYNWNVAQSNVKVAPNAQYTISASAAQISNSEEVAARVIVQLCDNNKNCGDNSQAFAIGAGDCSIGVGGHPQNVDLQFTPVSRNMERSSCTFFTNDKVASARVRVLTSSGGSLWFDNIQLEVGSRANNYVNYGSKNISYIKKAPDYLDCENNWVPACDNYAPSCEADELGCELYIPTNGDPSIPGIVSSRDYCSSECSGYEQYLQENTEIDRWFGADDIITYDSFIADTAQSCSLEEVGCEAFTNMTAGETVEYYNSLRMCVPDTDPDVTTYYTWEGSETTGFELRSWSLLKSDINDGPCTSVMYNGTTNVCNDTVNGVDTCVEEDDPACRWFVDENNDEYLVRESSVVKASNSCVQLRRAIDSADMALVLTSESGSCSAEAVGCKVYKGSDGSNVRRLFVDDFEAGTHGWTGGSLSSESVVTGGHSYKANSETILSKNVSIRSGKSYTLSFWLKASTAARTQAQISFNNDNDYLFAPSFSLDVRSVWKQYNLGPVYFDDTSSNNILSFNLNFPANNSYYYIDNIVLKEINSDLYLVKDSWNTPDQCTVEDLGCDEYEDRLGNTHYLSSFNSLCSESSVGCSMFIDTKNTKAIGAQTWDTDDQNITTEADELIYLVDDNQYYCSSRDKGCTVLGAPQFAVDNNNANVIDSWEDIYLINDPERYDLTLCGTDALNCEAYQSDGQTVYMRDPGERTCTFLDNYESNGQKLTGWYLTSSVNNANQADKIPCNESGELYKRRDVDWIGFAGECNSAAVGCTEFIDPQGTQGDNLLFNGDFEINTKLGNVNNDPEIPDFWCEDNTSCDGFTSYLNGSGRDNTNAVNVDYYTPSSNESFRQSFSINGGKDYTVKFDLRFISGDQQPPSEEEAEDMSFNLPRFINVAHALAGTTGIGSYSVGLYCEGATIESYDDSFIGVGGGVYKMLIKSSQTRTDRYSTFTGKFRADSSNNNIRCSIAFGNDTNSTFYLDNVGISETQSYYYINGNSINGADCNGQVSWESGCVLMLDTSNVDSDGEIIRQYDSNASYNNSLVNNGNLTVVTGCSPEDDDCLSDSNEVIKVTKNRECSEWLACRSSSYATEIDGSVKEYCYDLGRCTELSPSGNTCISWLEKGDEILTEDVYTARETGWSGQEYSGYSLLNKFNLESLLAKNKDGVLRLSNESDDTAGVGFNGITVEPTCRLFPDSDAPFSTIGLNIEFDDDGNIITKPLQMPQANFCSQGAGCECDYTEVNYTQGETRYYRSNYNGFTAIGDSQIKSVNNYRGFWGFCLEYDYSRTIIGYAGSTHPCLTWMPLDILSGEYNPSGVNIADDLNLDFDNMYYCLQSEGNYPYAGDVSIPVSLDLGEQAPENESYVWDWQHCGYYWMEDYYARTPEIVSPYAGFQDNSTIALCMNGGQQYPNVSVGVSNQDVEIWDEDSFGKEESVIESIEFNNVAAGWQIPGHDDYFVNGIGTDGVLKCQDDIYGNDPDECMLLNINGSSTITLTSEDEYSCVGGNINEDFCGPEDSKIWVKAFYTIDSVGGNPGITFDDESFIWHNFTRNNGGVFPFLDGEDGCLSANEFAGGYANCNNWNEYAMYAFFIVGFQDGDFDGVDNVSRYEVSFINPLEYMDGYYNIVQGYIYNVTVNYLQPDTSATEICTDFIRVGSPKFNNFINGMATFKDVDDNEISLDIDQYYSWYGMSNVDFNLNNYNQFIQVENENTSLSGVVAGTPYSVSQSGVIGMLDGSSNIDGHYYGVDSEDQDLVSAINSNFNGGDNNGLQWLKNLFARLIEKFSWDYGQDRYEQASFSEISTISSGDNVDLRQVELDSNGVVSEGNTGITINDKNSGNILMESNIYNATVKFYAYNETGDQLPLSRLMVDWDDGSSIFGENDETVSLKNHKNICVNSCTNSISDDNYWNDFNPTTSWGGTATENTSTGITTITQTSSRDDNWVIYRNTEIADEKFTAGDVVTLEYDFKISNNITATRSMANYWCYSTGYCSQSNLLLPGQTESYPYLPFADTTSLSNVVNGVSYIPNTNSGCPDGTETLEDGWCHYSSTVTIPEEMVTSCYNDNNTSGNCLRDLGVGRLNHTPGLSSDQSYQIKNLKLRQGCRSNAECTGTNNLCVPKNIGNDLNYCVDDYENGIGYFSFNHTYICSNPPTEVDGKPACVYTPKVYVEDNWGFCSKGSGSNCGVDTNGDGIFEAIIGWEGYDGEIILIP